ncbi:MAG: DUF1801 domain-containing protein [Acidimicrobiales bacterium]
MGADTDPKVDAYIDRSTKWPDELAAVRPILLDAGLTEAIKWGKPCYSHGKANIAILQEMKGFLAVMFFKGSLLEDPGGVLVEQGPNSRAAKRIELTSVDGVARLADTIAAYVAEAIDVEEAGLQVAPAPEPALCAELQHRIDTDAAFKAAFEEAHARTPAVQPADRRRQAGVDQEARVEKYAPKILAGKGFRD